MDLSAATAGCCKAAERHLTESVAGCRCWALARLHLHSVKKQSRSGPVCESRCSRLLPGCGTLIDRGSAAECHCWALVHAHLRSKKAALYVGHALVSCCQCP